MPKGTPWTDPLRGNGFAIGLQIGARCVSFHCIADLGA